MENSLKKQTLKSIAKAGLFSAISKVRENSNGYKFVTFTKGQAATNLYFGIKSADKVVVGENVNIEMLKTAEVVLAVNEDGEERLKLSLGGVSEYTNVESIFDIEDDSNEVSEAFKASFSLKANAPQFDEVDTETEVKSTRKLQAV